MRITLSNFTTTKHTVVNVNKLVRGQGIVNKHSLDYPLCLQFSLFSLQEKLTQICPDFASLLVAMLTELLLYTPVLHDLEEV